jgi:tight adherence protein C
MDEAIGPALIAAFGALTLFAFTIALLGMRSDAARRVAELESFSFKDSPAAQSKLLRRVLAGVDKSAVAAKLAEAGWYSIPVAQFVMTRLIAGGACAAAGFGGAVALHQTSFLFVSALVGAALGYIAPSFVIDSAIKARKSQIARRIPDLLDMVSTTVEAGTALNAALATAIVSLEGPLSEEIGIVLSDVRVGRSRADAFNAMAQRAKQVDLSSFVTAIVQTERLGGNIGAVLDELAQEARARRLSNAEAIAARLPVLMILPMAFFMLPALFVMIFTPVVAQMAAR